jgi:hypothetical protein
MPELGRQAAHVLLDAVSVFDPEGSHATNTTALSLAVERLDQVGAITATHGRHGVEVDASQLVGGCIVSLNWLVSLAADLAHKDPAYIIVGLRAFLDSDDH